MLALSRRPGERIVVPKLNISFEILQVKGNSVKVGISAPPEITILREEVAARAGHAEAHVNTASGLPLTHAQRNRLNTAALALHVVQKQLQAGLITNAETTLQSALKILESLDDSAGDVAPRSNDDEFQGIEALLVEDDPVEESLLTSFLRLSGFRVETVRDGYEALEYLAHHRRPDFVLLDMRLPRLNGPATVSAIRNNPQLCGLRIFAVTGSSPEEVGVSTGPGGVDEWFQKPVNPSRLAAAMNAAAVNRAALDAPAVLN